MIYQSKLINIEVLQNINKITFIVHHLKELLFTKMNQLVGILPLT